MKIIITGVPGTGKTQLGKAIAKEMRCELIEINGIVKRKGIYRKNKSGEMVVRIEKLGRELKNAIKGKKGFVLEGHLACEMRIPCDFIIVLRCEPKELIRRLEKRKYPEKKIAENALSEMLDYCLVMSEQNYEKRKIVQMDNTKFLTPKIALKKLKKGKGEEVRWLGTEKGRKLLKETFKRMGK